MKKEPMEILCVALTPPGKGLGTYPLPRVGLSCEFPGEAEQRHGAVLAVFFCFCFFQSHLFQRFKVILKRLKNG